MTQTRHYERYDKQKPPEEPLLSQHRISCVLDLARNIRANRFLDIGCGDGQIAMLLKQLSGANEVFGIDISPASVEAANRRGITATQLNIDEMDLPFDDKSFDLVYCGEVIEHLLDPDHLLDEVYRILHSGGYCVISTPNLAAWKERIFLLLGHQPYSTGVSFVYPHAGKLFIAADAPGWEGGHIRVMTLPAFRKLLELHRFKILSLMGARAYSPSKRLPLLFDLSWRFVDRILTHRVSLATITVALVQKGDG